MSDRVTLLCDSVSSGTVTGTMKIRPKKPSAPTAPITVPDPRALMGAVTDWVLIDPAASPLEVYSHLVARPSTCTPTALGLHVEEVLHQIGTGTLVAVPVDEPFPAITSVLTMQVRAEKLAYYDAFDAIWTCAQRAYADKKHCGARQHFTPHGPAVLEWELYPCYLDSSNQVSDWAEDAHLATVVALLYPSRLPLEIQLTWDLNADATKLSWDGFAIALAAADLPSRLARLAGSLVLPRRLG